MIFRHMYALPEQIILKHANLIVLSLKLFERVKCCFRHMFQLRITSLSSTDHVEVAEWIDMKS